MDNLALAQFGRLVMLWKLVLRTYAVSTGLPVVEPIYDVATNSMFWSLRQTSVATKNNTHTMQITLDGDMCNIKVIKVLINGFNQEPLDVLHESSTLATQPVAIRAAFRLAYWKLVNGGSPPAT